MAYPFLVVSAFVLAAIAAVSAFWPPVLWALLLVVPLLGLGLHDLLQRKQAVRRNFPLIGHFRYLFEAIRPEMYQYFIESDSGGTPFNRRQRSISYQRAKRVLQTNPFGTQRDVYEVGYEWINHSLSAREAAHEAPRITVGGADAKQRYESSLLNVSAMSFGALSGAAVRALSGGARTGGFFVNTGEGGLSPHHLEPGGDLVWQIGTGYFGCRSEGGAFDADAFSETAAHASVRMIEVKLSQGAKPGHGGILPAAKITPEIAAIRRVPMGFDVLSPPAHSAFDGPRGLLEFIARLRDASGGKPVGFKLCVGDPAEFLGVCMAMHETGVLPDFITVDGGEGGTGAAPIEFSDSIGAPLTDGLVLVHNALVGFDLRHRVKVIAAGKIITGFDMAARLAAGADLCNAARGFMFALGCIQARRCNSNHCPVGVATQRPALVRGLDVTDKSQRVASFQAQTVVAFLELLGACGIDHPDDLQPWHIHRRVSETEVRTFAEIYQFIERGALLETPRPARYCAWMERASADVFRSASR